MKINDKGQEYMKKMLFALLFAFIGFTVHWNFVETPKTFATKEELHELKDDMCTSLEDIKTDVRYLRKRFDALGNYYP